jgi:hypothetical protein
MKTTFFMLILGILAVGIGITLLVHQEQKRLNRIKNGYLRLLQKFEAWQMIR